MGYKSTAEKAITKAKQWNLPYWALEEGFIRSVSPSDPPLSLIVDPVGIYYDATRPSLLENMLNSEETIDSELLEKAEILKRLILKYKISKYNNGKPVPKDFFPLGKERILLVDQTYGDYSVTLGLADESSFYKMVQYTLEHYPTADIYIKLHPRVLTGEKRGYLHKVKNGGRIKVIRDNYNPIELISYFDAVFAVTSQMGFEALLLEKEVFCFGMPWYAGWGLTKDFVKCERRKKKRKNVIELLAYGYIVYQRWLTNYLEILNKIVEKKTFYP
ncbi:MAG: hypothetical protein N2327_06280 [Caldimicrobium sp.]|nr:hypothetical protein [Caldimicrobium sp.]MCX7874019.1 hypothetical protein [Caldimicrobium sp.]MDW8094167.1 polysialyltransferase family glycosyltransferase [Caldimicrobium sp.]